MLWYQRSLRWEFTFRWALSGEWVIVAREETFQGRKTSPARTLQ